MATDKFYTAEDHFTIYIAKIPFIYAFNIAISIGGPVLGMFGIFKYRSLIHRHLCKKRYRYSTIKLY